MALNASTYLVYIQTGERERLVIVLALVLVLADVLVVVLVLVATPFVPLRSP